jgi:transcriptional regulator with XRE-family HTH domain
LRDTLEEEELELLQLIGKRLRKRRRDIEVSQDEVARRAGFTRNFISQMERGEHSVELFRIYRIAAVLGVDFCHLVRPPVPIDVDLEPDSNPRFDRRWTWAGTYG